MNLESWMIFMAIWILASIPLGPNALNCISVSAAHGVRKGLWSVLGIFIAANIHMALAISGIAAFLTAHPQVFDVIRWAGVLYLIWLGYSLLRSNGKFRIESSVTEVSNWKLVRSGILISLSNPKAIFVWLAVFTQFIDVTRDLVEQLLVLAPPALIVTIVVYVAYCIIGLGVRSIFSGRRKLWFDRIAGSVYLAFAFGLATADLRRA